MIGRNRETCRKILRKTLTRPGMLSLILWYWNHSSWFFGILNGRIGWMFLFLYFIFSETRMGQRLWRIYLTSNGMRAYSIYGSDVHGVMGCGQRALSYYLYCFWWGGHCSPMHCNLFKIYCALPNFGITRTWICRLNFAQIPIFSGLRFFNEPEISDSGTPA